MSQFEIVCIANSRKLGGRCVAGVTLDGQWVRPVRAGGDGELHRPDYVLDNGAEVAALDVVLMELGDHVPEPHQPENWLLASSRWQFVGHLAGDEANALLRRVAAPGPSILTNRTDRLAWKHIEAMPLRTSLAIVEPDRLRWFITTSARGTRQTRAKFRFVDEEYDLSISDPAWERRLGHLAAGIHRLTAGGLNGDESIFLTVSLSEPFQGSCFKLIASIVAIG